jgi:hypothetical protein
VTGAVLPPPAFLIGIPVFEDGAVEQIEVRLRVDVQDGQAVFRLQIHAAGDVLRDAFDELCEVVAAATVLPLFHGTPEA